LSKKRLFKSIDSAGFDGDKDAIKAKIQGSQEQMKIFLVVDVIKIKYINQYFLDNHSANMKVIVNREKILGKSAGYKIFQVGLTYIDYEFNAKHEEVILKEWNNAIDGSNMVENEIKIRKDFRDQKFDVD
jgi:hypothetical protein